MNEPIAAIPRMIRGDRIPRYCEDAFVRRRRRTREVMVGDVGVGGSNPIRLQSMTTSDTMDTERTIQEVIGLVDAGCEIVRITAPSIREADNLKLISDGLRRQGVRVPLVADIHFTPNAALRAVPFVEKIRINPGNYADKKKFAVREYSDAEYELELERIEAAFKPLVMACKTSGVAMRIGTNHGSLSDRIMNRYGDTPAGMVASALEFVRICEMHGYHDLVLSMKSSNPQVMIAAYRLLASRMNELGMDYPFHLGVTEAGDGEDGRIKSAVGIGALLEDGIGDTIRVSLTEDSIHEIPAARAIAHPFQPGAACRTRVTDETFRVADSRDSLAHSRRWSQAVELPPFNLGGVHHVRVGVAWTDAWGYDAGMPALLAQLSTGETPAEIVRFSLGGQGAVAAFRDMVAPVRKRRSPAVAAAVGNDLPLALDVLADADLLTWCPDARLDTAAWRRSVETLVRAVSKHEKKAIQFHFGPKDVPGFLRKPGVPEMEQVARAAELAARIAYDQALVNFCISVVHDEIISANRVLASVLKEGDLPVAIALGYQSRTIRCAQCETLYQAATGLGSLLCDGIGDAVFIQDPAMTPAEVLRLSYGILQATRLRISKTEFISCPSCGRTLFDLQEVTARIKAKTSHLIGVKIAIMGCIVNGPGEMADADFGFVGASAGKINLYVGKELVERNIDMAEADERLIALIKSRNLWSEPAP